MDERYLPVALTHSLCSVLSSASESATYLAIYSAPACPQAHGDAAPPEGRLAHHGLPSLRPFGSSSHRALVFRPTCLRKHQSPSHDAHSPSTTHSLSSPVCTE